MATDTHIREHKPATDSAATHVPPSERIAQRKAWLESLPKPKARGWIHAITTPLALANSIVLLVLAPTPGLRVASLVYGISAVVLFGNSAIYHLGKWSVKVHSILRRIDHSNIFLLIAGTYTPLSVALLHGKTVALVLAIVWIGALAGILLSVFKPNAPRWLYTPLYIALGWVAIWFLPDFWASGSLAVVWLLIAGGVAYTLGAICYGFRWPNPWPGVWGFHEFFHLGTLIGYSCHAVSIWLAVMSVA
ncbi:MAG: hemolysin III family protein [Ancrocorticia sp.]|jgi:hemolysin III|nr:hemolysin III family protein [Ancrocorticia sp.]MCI1964480.1 hemolysin III family protein [Ancrocorticia sp.]MCI2002211.1 hemolysin III family protein [Ancrocorticia sp.]MCI2013525.1 hemolysin III family protein [Ancrocorticia sp.]MCI2030300.1 hemolysin III family protein [Ancrocorticia sp.]